MVTNIYYAIHNSGTEDLNDPAKEGIAAQEIVELDIRDPAGCDNVIEMPNC
jgi:hypothetical protein